MSYRARYNDKARSNKRGDQRRDGVAQDDAMDALGTGEYQVSATPVPEMILPESSASARPDISELLEPGQKISNTKRKRLEKYIEKKLKKDRRVELMKQLAESSYASALLKPSKQLGQGKETVRQQLRQAFLEEKVGIRTAAADAGREILVREIDDAPQGRQSDHGGDDRQIVVVSKSDINVPTIPVALGAALKRKEPMDTAGDATVSKRKRKTRKAPRPVIAQPVASSSDDSASDHDEPLHVVENVPKLTDEAAVSPIDSAPVVVAATTAEAISGAPNVAPKKAFHVAVNRSESVQEARLKLPVVAEEQAIMESISENDVVVLCGETGSGKTTQVPQFLYEAGYGNPASGMPGKIGITQPRRVAAVSMAKRVAAELGLSEKEVSYQIRYDGTVNRNTAVKFMTDGVLLKEISLDFLLKDYSCIIVDEAHERSLNTDILIGLLSRIVRLRAKLALESSEKNGAKITPLKLVVMSATLRVQDFTENKMLFVSPPPVIKVDARQYPVTVHFNRRTPESDYVTEAFKKVCKIHSRLPEGGILVFLSGQNEISVLCKQLRQRFSQNALPQPDDVNPALKRQEVQRRNENAAVGLEDASEMIELMDEGEANATSNDADIPEDLSLSDSDDDEQQFPSDPDAVFEGPMLVLPLYAMLPTAQQMRVFDAIPPGTRLCVVATNVAETSLTIPGIKYVVDAGKVKERQYDLSTGVSSFDVSWISKSSADQRTGRAGRVGPGHCYRLYSSAVFENYFPQFSMPEIQRMPIEGIVLQMKNMSIDNIVNFPFPTPPERKQLLNAEKLLVQLGALDGDKKQITQLGKRMAMFPVSPRYAKMIMVAQDSQCLDYAIALVATLTVGDPFTREVEQGLVDSAEGSNGDADEKEQRQRTMGAYHQSQAMFSNGTLSDALAALRAVGAYEYAAAPEQFCQQHFVRLKAMEEIHKLRGQLSRLFLSMSPGASVSMNSRLRPFDAQQMLQLKQIFLSGFIDQVAVRKGAPNRHCIGETVYMPLISNSLRDGTPVEQVHLHPSSCIYRNPPQYVAYAELVRTSKVFMKNCTAVDDASWLAAVGPTLCRFSKPLDEPMPRYDAKLDDILCYCSPTFGDSSIELPPSEMSFPTSVDRVRYLARFLLDGQLFPALASFKNALISKPTLMTNKKIPVTQTKIMAIVQPLMDRNVKNKQDLAEVWRAQPTFLLRALLLWLPSDKHAELSAIWPPLGK